MTERKSRRGASHNGQGDWFSDRTNEPTPNRAEDDQFWEAVNDTINDGLLDGRTDEEVDRLAEVLFALTPLKPAPQGPTLRDLSAEQRAGMDERIWRQALEAFEEYHASGSGLDQFLEAKPHGITPRLRSVSRETDLQQLAASPETTAAPRVEVELFPVFEDETGALRILADNDGTLYVENSLDVRDSLIVNGTSYLLGPAPGKPGHRIIEGLYWPDLEDEVNDHA
jgi:hypothetical protein